MNTFKKYCPNVFVAQCEQEYKKGDVITLTTKYGKEVKNEVHNFLGKTKGGLFLYSIARTDGTDSQTRAQAKAQKLESFASNAEKRADAYYQASNEGKDFLILGEPIKVGHHSERRHRKLIERKWQRMGKAVAESDKADEYKRRAEYWKIRANKIDLSMPESLEYFEFELQKAKDEHKRLKENPELRSHSMSLQYANKRVKELEDKVKIAIKLWGDDEDIQALAEAEKQAKEAKKPKKDVNAIIAKYYGFFAFNDEQFRKGYEKAKAGAMLEDGEKVTHVFSGLYIPSKFVQDFLKEYKK